MAGEYDKQFEQLTQLIKDNAERTDSRFDQLTERVDSIETLTKRTAGRLDELTLEMRDLRNEVGPIGAGLGETNQKIDALQGDVTGAIIDNTHRIATFENRVDTLEGNTH